MCIRDSLNMATTIIVLWAHTRYDSELETDDDGHVGHGHGDGESHNHSIAASPRPSITTPREHKMSDASGRVPGKGHASFMTLLEHNDEQCFEACSWKRKSQIIMPQAAYGADPSWARSIRLCCTKDMSSPLSWNSETC